MRIMRSRGFYRACDPRNLTSTFRFDRLILNLDLISTFFEEYEISLRRMLTDRGTEYCGNPEHHE